MSLLTLKDESIAHCTGVQTIFMLDVMSVKSAIGEYGNPFLETCSDILVLDTRDIGEKCGVYNVYRMESQGYQQYYNLYANGSCSHEEEQYTLNPHKRQRTTSSGLVSSLKSDRNPFSRFFVASQFRGGNPNDYFSHKNQPFPPSLSARGKLKLGTESDIVRCLEDVTEKQDDITPSVDVVMLVGPAMLCVLKPAASETLREYACRGCVPTVCGTSTG